MSDPVAIFFTFHSHAAADEAIRTLGRSGFDLKKLSLVGMTRQSPRQSSGLPIQRACTPRRGRPDAVWARLSNMLLAAAALALPALVETGTRQLAVRLLDALQGAIVAMGGSSPGSMPGSIARSARDAIGNADAGTDDQYRLVVHGRSADHAWAARMLGRAMKSIITG